MLNVKADTVNVNMTQKTKDRRYDGRSRPTNDLYSKRWDEIFKKEKTTSELLREGYEEEKKMREEGEEIWEYRRN